MSRIYELNLQNVADQLKSLVLPLKPSDHRRRAVAAIKHFEARQWQPGAFVEAMSRVWPGQFALDDQGRLSYTPATGDPSEVCDAVGRLVVEYSIMVMPDEDPQPPKLYTTEQAATYLGMSVAGVKKHIYKYGDLVAVMHGHDLLFSQQDLDALKAVERRPGPRPKVK